MNRRTAILTGIALFALAIGAFPRTGSAQSAVRAEGVFQMNPAKSKYNAGPAPKSFTAYFQLQGQNSKITGVGIGADGNPIVIVFHDAAEDGKPYPVTGTPEPDYDANTMTRVDAYTLNGSRTKAGRVVQTTTFVMSQDGKSFTLTTTGTNANGRPINSISVWEKQ
jgi:hypothetical protein